ncbi:glycosyltransferase, CAZy family GT2 [Selaginella moellendorffii]|uniref:Glycosyltransferase, CAZy family GT2 n=1 Tax=Selaginella moellendorffii TaxID=88036 RepID=D8RKK5_SELML|nr:glycosyltransferase, CAZy family GT2 [Selaginella moellendorffii]
MSSVQDLELQQQPSDNLSDQSDSNAPHESSSSSSSPSSSPSSSTSLSAAPQASPWGKLIWHTIICLLVSAHMATFVNYLGYRFYVYSKHPGEFVRRPWLIILTICEVIYFLNSVIGAVDLVLPPRIWRPRQSLSLNWEDLPTVDIFLPCCKEPTDVPEDSIQAALAMDYPKHQFRVLVLDDGGDDQLKQYCEVLEHVEPPSASVRYLRRVKIPGVPHNFKCGNLNYGLEHSDAEFVVMMDADMILHPSFLKTLLPHIVKDPKVSFVQIPQSFYNLPVGDPLNDACGFCYERLMIHRDTFGAAPCVGTGAIFRRKHLDEIGGFQPMSITEDTTTAFKLFNQGFKSVYLNRNLQIGLIPWTFEGYIKQRQRWCQGAIQQFSATWREMLGPKSKLSLVLKVSFFWHTGYYFIAIVNLVMLLLFIVCLALHLDLMIGTSHEAWRVIIQLAIFLIFWRLSWMSVWLSLPQSIRSRNRDESHFWWMTPFFLQTIYKSIFSYSSTFTFTPTSSIDRVAAQAKLTKQPALIKIFLVKLKHVKVHIIYILLVLAVVAYRISWVAKQRGRNCSHDFYVIAMSFFLLSTWTHMLVPIVYILCPPSYKPGQRKGLLHYREKVPHFVEGDHLPKWHWSAMFYEAIANVVVVIFWVAALVIAVTKAVCQWCKTGAI